MAATSALGSQETRNRLGHAYNYVSTEAEFQLKRFENYYTVRSSSFSELTQASFALQPIAVRGESRHIPFLGLFDGTKVQEQLYSTRLVEFFQTHDAALQKELQTNLDSKEKTLGKILGKFLFKPLVGEYRLARQEYREEEDSKTCYLGMGHPSSWHGWPDMVAGETPPAAGNTPIVLATTDKAEEESTESEPESADSRDVEQSQEGQQSTGSSPGDKTVVEVKRRGLTGVLNQLVAQTVVFSYTMGNRHPDLNPMVPGIAINAQEYKIVLFDHVNDLLLITRALPYKKFESSAMDDAGILLLWVVLNHREFMLSFQTSRNSLDLKSHFPAVAGYDMHYFKGLFSYTLDAASVKRIPKVGGRTSVIDWYEPPEPKKYNMSGYQPLDVQPKAVGMVNSQPTLEKSDNLALSLFTCLCCFLPLGSRYFWPLGILALIYSCLARDSYKRGDIAEGELSANAAAWFSLAGIVSQLLALALLPTD